VTEPRTGARLRILAIFVVFMFAALTTRLWFLQVLAAEEKRNEAQDNAVRLVEVPAPRGRILDARGKVLVGNRPSLVVTMNREAAGAHKEEVLFRLSRILDVPADELGRRLDDPRYYVFSPVPIATDIPRRTYFYLMEHADEFPGIEVVKAPVRTYPYGDLAAHALGYLGQISQDELKDPSFAGYRPGDIIGRTGVEAVYEHDLVGTPGVVKYRVNSAGRNLGVIGDQDPVEGNDVRLTIQARIQQLAEDELGTGIETARQILDPNTDSYLRANAGAVLVMDPDTGAIEAIASAPTFDPSLFSRSISTEEFDRRFGASTGYPLLNRAIYGEYPPGSTYKPWVALSGLSRGLLSTDRYYPCPPSWTVPYDETDPEAIQYVFDNWTSANLGSMNLAQALVMSCDTVFYPLGYEYWKIYYPPPNDDGIEGNDDLPPKELFQRDLEAMGFGHVTRVDLTGEQGGRVPDAAWKSGIHEEYPRLFPEGRWVPGDFVNMSIGQGDSLVTPIQMAAAYSALQNGGRMCVPHVLMQVETSDGRVVRPMKPKCRKVPFSQSDLTYVRDALTGVPQRGTASGAFAGFPFSQVWVAGKTGTAEVFGRQDYSWFAAMTEASGERHVVVALVEQGGHGSTTAAPIVRHVIEGIYGLNATEVGQVQATD
jgi:penicillin-binding protein 2